MFKKGDILIAKTSSILFHHNRLTIGKEVNDSWEKL